MPLWNAPLATQAEVAAAQASADASLKIAANLSDVASASASRNNIGANNLALETRFADLSAGTGEVRFLQWPFGAASGFALRLSVVLEGALLTGDADIAIAINGAPTDPATITIPLAGSGTGVQTLVTFVGSNTIPGNGVVSLTVGGANTAAVGASVVATCIF